MILTELIAKLVYKDDPQGKEKIQASIKTMQDGLNNLQQGANKAVNGLKPLAVGFASVFGGASLAVNKFLQDNDAMAKSARDIGITSQAFQELGYVADDAGVSASNFESSMQKLSQNLLKAQTEGGASAYQFEELGISLFNAQGEAKGTEEIMYELATAFESMPDNTLKSAKAMELFGKSGIRMGVMLGQGSEKMRELVEEAHDMGMITNDETLDSIENVNTQISKIKKTLSTVWGTALTTLIPEIERIVQLMNEWIQENRAILQQRIQEFFQGVIQVTQKLTPLLIWMLTNWKLIALAFASFQFFKIASGLTQMAQGFLQVGGAIKSLSSISAIFELIKGFMASNPLGMILVSIGALVATFIYLEKEFQIFSQAWEYFTNKILPPIASILERVFEVLKPIGLYVFNNLIKYFSIIWDIISSFVGIFAGVEGSVGKLGKSVLSLLLAPFKLVVETIKGILNLLGSWLGFNGQLGNSIMSSIGGAFSYLRGIIKGVIDFFYSHFSRAIENVINLFSSIFGVFTGVEGATEKLGESILNLLLMPFQLVIDTIKGILNLLGSWFGFNGQLGDSIVDSIGGAFNWIYELVDSLGRFVIETFGGAIEAVTGFLSPIVNGVGGAISKVGSFFGMGKEEDPYQTIENVEAMAQNGFIRSQTPMINESLAGDLSRGESTVNNSESFSRSNTNNTTINISNSVHANDISVIEDVQKAQNLQSYRSR